MMAFLAMAPFSLFVIWLFAAWVKDDPDEVRRFFIALFFMSTVALAAFGFCWGLSELAGWGEQ